MSDADQMIRDSLERLASAESGDSRPSWDRLVQRRARRRARRIAAVAGASLVLVIGAAAVTGALDDPGRPEVAEQTVQTPPGAETPDDTPLDDGSMAASCVSLYSPATLAERAFAFDGTVREVTFQPASSEEELDVTLAVFDVHAWYAGGSGETVAVQMQRPVAVGDRLLVAGEPRWGGAPLDDAIAWECGFTSDYSVQRADEWAEALADG